MVLIGPAKSKWFSWFGSFTISCLFISVCEIRVFKFLPAALQLGQFSSFSLPSPCIQGYQNASADWSMLFVETCISCNMAISVVLRASGMTILSLKNNNPKTVIRCSLCRGRMYCLAGPSQVRLLCLGFSYPSVSRPLMAASPQRSLSQLFLSLRMFFCFGHRAMCSALLSALAG